MVVRVRSSDEFLGCSSIAVTRLRRWVGFRKIETEEETMVRCEQRGGKGVMQIVVQWMVVFLSVKRK